MYKRYPKQIKGPKAIILFLDINIYNKANTHDIIRQQTFTAYEQYIPNENNNLMSPPPIVSLFRKNLRIIKVI